MSTVNPREDWVDEYPDAEDEWPAKAPEAMGKECVVSAFVDASHGFDIATRRSITGYIVYLNSTPVLWCSKKQGCVECSTYSAELVACLLYTSDAADE